MAQAGQYAATVTATMDDFRLRWCGILETTHICDAQSYDETAQEKYESEIQKNVWEQFT